MTGRSRHETYAALLAACATAGLDATGAEPIRLAENAIWRLPGGLVARIAKPGQQDHSARELRLARWLTTTGIPAVRPYPGLHSPVLADDRPVTFWEELPPHGTGTVLDVATLLKQLHALPLPNFPIGHLDPFIRISDRIDAATTLSAPDRTWLHSLLTELRAAWTELPPGLPECVVHGDAWTGNIARPLNGADAILLDLERCSQGPPEWDLVSTAIKLTTTGTITPTEYDEFCTTYGTDVLQWPGYNTMRRTRELRMTTYAAQHAATHPEWRQEAQHRVDCLRGRAGQGPWRWRGIA
ncbi:phosphotransferase [Streptomyces paludis]|uniref:Aminoglycoside phosphotransferase family protein n=1 Tax=Streptomyces paludis TaxID=2282738 RepID=A0A345HRA6_9ACTN|nr:aminoglycoside phosphotransferase family protein [Streptomyces paludis]AXG79230.1 aminoglycoside phosphotransferase family protein [Streptomyces paludis]